MPRYVLNLKIECDLDRDVPPVQIVGDFDEALNAMEASLKTVLDEALESTALATVTFVKKGEFTAAQTIHGERIAARGRHNGTSEA